MRNFLSLFFPLAVLIAACGDSGSSASIQAGAALNVQAKLTSIQWIDSVRNFGKITEGQKLAVSFRFRNSGNQPLVIESVSPSCGCTVAEYPREPIAPGAEAEISGEFDSNGREGLQHKEITVQANTPERQHRLQFEVSVVKKNP